jgi:hypothetical protein
MKNIYTILFIISCLVSSCQNDNGKDIDYDAIRRLNEFENIKDILLRNKVLFAKQKGMQNPNIILSADIDNFKSNIIPNNPKLKKDLREIELVWENLGESAQSIGLEKDNTVSFNVKFYNGGLDSSYHHSIIYDPNNLYSESGNKCSDLYLIKVLKENWKYIICRTGFG